MIEIATKYTKAYLFTQFYHLNVPLLHSSYLNKEDGIHI